MNLWLGVLVAALLWILLSSEVAKRTYPKRFSNYPTLGLVVWFTTLFSSLIAVLVAIVSLGGSYLSSTDLLAGSEVGEPAWIAGFAMSFLPWLALAGFGVFLALSNLRLEEPVDQSRKIQSGLDLAKQFLKYFQGVPVYTIDLPAHFAMAGKKQILISKHSVQVLEESELEAVLWHELGHVRMKHWELKKFAAIIAVLTKPLSVSEHFRESVYDLTELAADRFAIKHCDETLLSRVRAEMETLRNI